MRSFNQKKARAEPTKDMSPRGVRGTEDDTGLLKVELLELSPQLLEVGLRLSLFNGEIVGARACWIDWLHLQLVHHPYDLLPASKFYEQF
jgi:hypothetical protein